MTASMTTLSGIDWNWCPAWIGISVRLRSESLSGIIGIRTKWTATLEWASVAVRQPRRVFASMGLDGMLVRFAVKRLSVKELAMESRDWTAETDLIIQRANEWAKLMEEKPFVNNNGMGPQTAFQLYYWISELAPKLIVESGTWRGFSTWVLRKAAPQARIICLDPIFALGHILDYTKIGAGYWPHDVERTGMDFSCAGFESMEKPQPSVVLFDDHQHKVNRLEQGIQKGFQHMIFDDNLPGKATHYTFFHHFQKASRRVWMEQVAERFDVFPPLWDTQAGLYNETFVPGLNIPRCPELACLETIHQPTSDYTWLTYVKIKDSAMASRCE